MIRYTDHLRIVEFLKHFDCNTREAETYVECLQLGPATVQEIAHKMKSNRITVHSTIEQLIEKGLLFETRKAKKRLIASESPDVLHRILQRRTNEIKLIEHNLAYIVNILHAIHPTHKQIPAVRLYEDIDGFKKMLEETLTSKTEVLIFTCSETFGQSMPRDYMEDFYLRRSEAGVHTRIIYPPGEFATHMNTLAKKYNLHVRTTSVKKAYEAAIYLWDSNIALRSFKDDKIVCTIFEHEDIASFFRDIIYEELWADANEIA